MSSSNRDFSSFYVKKERKDIFQEFDEFYSYLETMKANKEYAYRRVLQKGSSSHVQIKDIGDMIMMGSNNYLDMACNPQVVAAGERALKKYGHGSGSVSLLGGTCDLHSELEEKIASFYSRTGAAIFSTGYSSNVGTISALMQEGDLILLDMYSHMSLVDGTKLTGATVKFFKHNDMEHLEQLLKKLRDKFGGVLIVTDGVFSMDGDVCPLDKLIELKKKYNARLMIDEAHAIGIIGKTGRGTEEYFNCVGGVDIVAGTLSKSPAGLGGYIAGDKRMVEYVRHFANSYIFSTSLPPAVVGGLVEVFNIFEKDFSHMEKLQKNILYFTSHLRSLGINIGNTITAIVPVIIADELKTKLIAKEMAERHIFCSAVVFPAVSKTQSRLRISLMSSHTREDLDKVLTALEELCRKYKVI